MHRGWRNDSFWTHPWIYRTFLKRIPVFFDTRALIKSQYWQRTMHDSLAAQKIRRTAEHAAHIPLWENVMRENEIRPEDLSIDSLATLPIISKKTFASLSPEQYCDMRRARQSVYDHTSGSTGRPLNFWFDWMSELRSFAITERIMRSVGTARLPVVYMRSRYRQGFTFRKHIWFFLRGFGSVQYRLRDLLDIGKRLHGKFILYGYTSSVVEVARQLRDAEESMPVAAVMATGENISPTSRALVEETLSSDFRMVYASREAGWLAFECEYKTMHINEEWAYIEIVDSEGKRIPDGEEGRIIVTCFEARAMPLIRYDIGDRGVRNRSTCACKRTLDTLHMSGREAEYIRFSNGYVVSLLDISAAVDSFAGAVQQFQIILRGEADFLIRVIPGPLFDEVLDTLSELLTRTIHPSAQISWEKVESISEAESGKARYFIRETTNTHADI